LDSCRSSRHFHGGSRSVSGNAPDSSPGVPGLGLELVEGRVFCILPVHPRGARLAQRRTGEESHREDEKHSADLRTHRPREERGRLGSSSSARCPWRSRCGSSGGEEPRLSGHALQRVVAAIGELEARARDQVLHRARHEDLAGGRLRDDAGTDVTARTIVGKASRKATRATTNTPRTASPNVLQRCLRGFVAAAFRSSTNECARAMCS